jgi:hypothetical protein
MSTISRIIAAAAVLAVAITPFATSIATQLPEGINEQLSFVVSPELPGPGDPVTISVTSYSSNLNAADISWFVNGALVTRGIGATKFSFTNGSTGATTKVDVFIVKAEGGELARSFSFAPADLELTFEAEGYVHPFYKGRTVFTHQSPYRVVAIPRFIGSNGGVIPESQLVYNWRVNDRAVQDQSGYGKSVLRSVGSLVSRPFSVSVEVTDQSGIIKAEASTYIEPYESEVLMYEDNPLYGIMYERAVDGPFELDRQEVALLAVPYFFGINTPKDIDIEYEWRLAGSIVSLPPNQNRMVVRNVDNVKGTSNIGLFVSHMTNILQAAQTSAVLNYDETNQ